MGRQTLIDLHEEDEAALAAFLIEIKGAQIIDVHYPTAWDRKSVARTKDAKSWLIINPRTINTLVANSNQTGLLLGCPGRWQIRGLGGAAIEWNREKQKGIPDRLFLDTTNHPLGEIVHDLVGDSVEKLYRAAITWIKKHCIPLNTNGPTIWRSR